MIPKSLLRHGFQLFPVIDGGKLPAVAGWQDSATDKPKWLNGGHCNAGVFTGRYRDGALLVVDLDKKDGKDGEEALAMLFPELPATFTVKTPSGGKHLYFYTKQRLANSVGKIAPGIDVRSQGGYVVAPGSKVPAGEYKIVADVPVADAPAWLEAECRSARDKATDRTPVIELDQPHNEAKAIDWLRRHSPIDGTPGHSANNKTFLAACMVKDFGISEANCLALMLEHFERDPPWTADVLAPTVASAYRNSQEPPGVKGVGTEDFEPVALASAGKVKDSRLPLIQYSACRPDLSRVDLIEGWLPQGGMTVIYGESNAGKSFVAIDMAFHIAAGWDWMGHRVFQCPTVLIAAEGGVGVYSRMAALQVAFGERLAQEGRALESVPFYLIPASVDLRTNLDDAKRVLDRIKEIEAKHNARVGFQGVDTLSRAMAGGNENGPEDMGAYVKTIDLLRQATSANVASVHHAGKDLDRGARGHSLLRAATDTEIEVRDGTIYIVKQRDMEFAKPIGFDLSVIELGVNSYGKMVTSCVIERAEAVPKKPKEAGKVRLSENAKFALEHFNNLYDVEISRGAKFVTLEAWQNRCKNDEIRGFRMNSDERRFKEQFKRCVAALEKAYCVTSFDGNQYVRSGDAVTQQ